MGSGSSEVDLLGSSSEVDHVKKFRLIKNVAKFSSRPVQVQSSWN